VRLGIATLAAALSRSLAVVRSWSAAAWASPPEAAARIEMHLVSDSPQEVRLERLGLTIGFPEGEDIWTESSYKFTRAGVEGMLAAARLRLVRWHVDPANYFALALAAPS